jgi:hypothetical protein
MSYKWNTFLTPAGINADGTKVQLTGLGGAMAGALFGAGSSSNKATKDTANTKFLAFYFDTGATSGDNRGMYLRTYYTGTGGGGDSARIFATVSAAVGTVHGSHISLNFGSNSNKCTGQGVALRSTIHIPNGGAMPSGGTYAALQAEAYCDGTDSDPSNTTQFSLMRFVVAGGNAAARNKVTKLMTIEGVTTGASNMIQTGQNEPTWASKTCLIRILVGGTPMNLIAVDPS